MAQLRIFGNSSDPPGLKLTKAELSKVAEPFSCNADAVFVLTKFVFRKILVI